MKNIYYTFIPAAIRISVPKRVSLGQKEVLDMTTMQRILRRLGIRKSPKVVATALYALLGIMTLAVMTGLLATPRSTAFADSTVKGNEPWLEINCLENVVEEGDDFRLIVYKKYDSDWPHKTMRVFWYTSAITADETDYEHLYAERQASNGYQSKHGRMGRDFHTLEDVYPEADETFKVRFNNSVDYGTDGECIITIKDDDGVGIHKLEITSEPQEINTGSEDGETVVGYAEGDVIEITAHFTGPVTHGRPGTSEQADYTGLYIQVGENRRLAEMLRGNGTDRIVFGYQVQAGDVDADGISVESGGPGTGLYYSETNRDGGIWAVDEPDGRINRLFHGLDDDPEHIVVQTAVKEPTVVEPEITIVEPTPEDPVEVVASISAGLIETMDGELTDEDNGRDWISIDLTGGENYIIELKSKMEFIEGEDGERWWLGGYFEYVEDQLIDPSILEMVNSEGEQVLGEHSRGGFMGNFARAFFVPDEDGTYYIAVGAGRQDRGGTGLYTLSIRADDYPDDFRANPGPVLRPGESVTGVIDSDVSPNDPGLNPWDWAASDDVGIPVFGVESLDDRDVFRVEVSEEARYVIAVSDAPSTVGIWGIWNDAGVLHGYSEDGPVREISDTFSPGTYYVDVGTPYLSVGNTGSYTVSLDEVADDV